MGESSPNKGSSPGQDHSQEQHPRIGAPGLGNTGDSRAGNVSDGNVGARVCQSKGSYRGGTVVWWAHILKLFRKRSFVSKNVMLSNFEPSGVHGHSQFSLGWGIYNWGQSDNQADNNVHFIAL